MEKRYIDTELWINELMEIVRSGKTVPLDVTGNSMLPFLKGGRDRVILTAFSSPAKVGDILLYKRKNGDFVLHRVIDINNDGLFFAGDIHSVIEGPVSESDVIARVTSARRNGQLIRSGSKQWSFFEKKWIKTLKYRKYFSRLIFALYR